MFISGIAERHRSTRHVLVLESVTQFRSCIALMVGFKQGGVAMQTKPAIHKNSLISTFHGLVHLSNVCRMDPRCEVHNTSLQSCENQPTASKMDTIIFHTRSTTGNIEAA